jgi:hypothetical protein
MSDEGRACAPSPLKRACPELASGGCPKGGGLSWKTRPNRERRTASRHCRTERNSLPAHPTPHPDIFTTACACHTTECTKKDRPLHDRNDYSLTSATQNCTASHYHRTHGPYLGKPPPQPMTPMRISCVFNRPSQLRIPCVFANWPSDSMLYKTNKMHDLRIIQR